MGSHSVIFHPTQANALHVTPARQASTRLTYPRVHLGEWIHTKIV